MPNTYEYIDKTGKTATIDAVDANTALSTANKAPDSGVRLVRTAPTSTPVVAPTATSKPTDTPAVGSMQYDILNNLAPGTSASGSYMTPAQQEAKKNSNTNYLSTITDSPTAPSEEAIRESARARAQAIANSIRQSYVPQFQDVEKTANRRNLRTQAQNRSAGLSGSDFASSNAQQSEDIGAKDKKMLEDEMNQKVTDVLYNMDQRATEEYRQKRQDYLAEVQGDYEKRTAFYKSQQDTAIQNATALASAGVDLSKLKEKSPDTYKQLLEESGYSEGVFKAIYNSKLPENQQRKYEYKTVGNKLYAISYNPATKKIETDEISTPGASFDQFMIAPDGTPLFIDKTNGKVQIAGGFNESQFLKPTAPKATTSANTAQMTNDLKEAFDAINRGADVDEARRLFLQDFPGKQANFDAYMKGVRN